MAAGAASQYSVQGYAKISEARGITTAHWSKAIGTSIDAISTVAKAVQAVRSDAKVRNTIQAKTDTIVTIVAFATKLDTKLPCAFAVLAIWSRTMNRLWMTLVLRVGKVIPVTAIMRARLAKFTTLSTTP